MSILVPRLLEDPEWIYGIRNGSDDLIEARLWRGETLLVRVYLPPYAVWETPVSSAIWKTPDIRFAWTSLTAQRPVP